MRSLKNSRPQKACCRRISILLLVPSRGGWRGAVEIVQYAGAVHGQRGGELLEDFDPGGVVTAHPVVEEGQGVGLALLLPDLPRLLFMN